MRTTWNSCWIFAVVATLMLAIPGRANAHIPVPPLIEIVGSNTLCADGIGGFVPCCTICDNWISLPFANPFIGLNIREFCDSNLNGLIDDLDAIAFVAIQGLKTVPFPPTFDETHLDSFITHNCALPFTDNPPYEATRSVRLRPKPFMGLDIPYAGFPVPFPLWLIRGPVASGGTCKDLACDNWVDVPVLTTALTLRDFCDTNLDGLVDALDVIQFVSMQGRQLAPFPPVFDNHAVDSFVTHNCLLPFTNNPLYQVGRAVRLRLKLGLPDQLIVPP